MNGVHDMGGMHGMGPVRAETNEPVFHEAWEGRVHVASSPLVAGNDRDRNAVAMAANTQKNIPSTGKKQVFNASAGPGS